MADLLITAAMVALPLALALWLRLAPTDRVRRRERRRALRGISPGMAVYGADGQPVGAVDERATRPVPLRAQRWSTSGRRVTCNAARGWSRC